MNAKRIDVKLYKAIMMAFQYQINCELTPEQCKELIDVIDNPLQVEDECVWKSIEWSNKISYISPHYDVNMSFGGISGIPKNYYIYCPTCGKRIKYVEE